MGNVALNSKCKTLNLPRCQWNEQLALTKFPSEGLKNKLFSNCRSKQKSKFELPAASKSESKKKTHFRKSLQFYYVFYFSFGSNWTWDSLELFNIKISVT